MSEIIDGSRGFHFICLLPHLLIGPDTPFGNQYTYKSSDNRNSYIQLFIEWAP